MDLTLFDFPLPDSLIAQEPLSRRDSSRLLVAERRAEDIRHLRFPDIREYMRPGDMLLLNRTRVLPARLPAIKERTGEPVEILLVKEVEPGIWDVLYPGKYKGPVLLGEGVEGGKGGEGLRADLLPGRRLGFQGGRDQLFSVGRMPLPPYINRFPDQRDVEWYQTVYAEDEGSVAAPTAGLHFTSELLDKLGQKGVLVRYLTLHVGVGTFTPVRSERLEDHRMESENYFIPLELPAEIKKTKELGGRLITVGTTTTRAMEGYYASGGVETGAARLSADGRSIEGSTDIFLKPGHEFRAVDGLLTNFHLPRSTPLVLASAFLGRERLLGIYREAIERSYRFFSYGDAMLIV